MPNQAAAFRQGRLLIEQKQTGLSKESNGTCFVKWRGKIELAESVPGIYFLELTAKKMQTFVTAISPKRSPKTFENIVLTLSSILGFARKWGYAVPVVSLSDLALPEKVKSKSRCFAPNAMKAVVQSADEPLATICLILATTGMRIGEVLALRTEDLDFERKLIHVRNSVYAGRIGSTKSKASMASLPIPSALEARLRKFLNSRNCRKNELNLIFANRRLRPYSAYKLREKKLRPLLKKLGSPLGGFMVFDTA